jgi:hypothetical protein
MTAEDTKRHNELNHRLSQLTPVPGWASDITWMQFSEPGRARTICKDPDGIKELKHGSNVLLVSWANASIAAQGLATNLALLREQLTTPPHRSGGGYEPYPMSTLRPDFVRMRTAAQWLAAVAAVETHNGRNGEALTNLTAILDLADAYDQEPGLVTFMIQNAIGSLGAAACWDALQSDRWTETQLATLQERWGRWNVSSRPAHGLEGDRVLGFAIGNEYRKIGSKPTPTVAQGAPKALRPFVETTWHGFGAPYDLAAYLEQTQDRIEAVRLLEAGAPWSKVKAALEACDLKHQPRWTWQNEYLIPFTSTAIPRVDKAALFVAKMETLRQMVITAIAIERHIKRNGLPPKSLSELIPGLLQELPHDCFSGQPLCYRLSENGGYLLYSVGTNGSDDGGKGDPLKPAKQWDLWDSLDAVWPAPAKP